MDGINNRWTNELMETEDVLLAEMREEYRGRLQIRLQESLDARQQGLAEVSRLARKRKVDLKLKTTLGWIVVRVTKGYCLERKEWIVPIREAWGLDKHQ